MSELREVKLSQLRPNPFRDIENYPFWRDKLDRLKESIKSTGAWPNIIVRPMADTGFFELAYGHHRVEAIRELGVPSLMVIETDLPDDAMLKMMADENAEEFGTNFMLGTMNAVSAVVKAFSEGKISLGAEEKAPESHVRFAPSYLRASFPDVVKTPMRYTAQSLATYLGWLREDGMAEARVHTALASLELIELGVCKPQAFQGLSHEQAKAVVQQAQLVYKTRMRELEKDAEEKEAKKAREEAKKQASASVAKVVGAFRDGAGVREVAQETRSLRERVEAVPTQKKVDPTGTDISRMLDRAAGELEDLAVKVDILADRSENLLKLFGAGAICDKGVEKKVGKSFLSLLKAGHAFHNHFLKSQEKRG